MRQTSFSQNNLFEKCPRSWYFQYIKHIKTVQDMSYALAGTVLHNTLEQYYLKKENNIDQIKEFFDIAWSAQKLDSAQWLTNNIDFIRNQKKKEEYWAMVLNGIHLQLQITDLELEIKFDDVKGYLDVVDTNNDLIFDWKTSTRSDENEEDYIKQLLFYSYLYYRKFNRIPKETKIFYLKYNSTPKNLLIVTPTIHDIYNMEKWHRKIQAEMEQIILTNKLPTMCTTHFFFCSFKEICVEQKETIDYSIITKGNYLQLIGPITPILQKQLDRKFSFELKDSFWIKKHNPYANTQIRYWNPRNNSLPIGFKDALIKTLNDYAEYKKFNINIIEQDLREFTTETIKMPEAIIGKELREYQKEAVETLINKKIALLEIGTGGGKTLIATEAIRRIAKPTLFIVDKIELMRQTKKVLEESLGIEIGQIGQGIIDIKPITVATIQTIHKKLKELRDYLATLNFAILDECHHASAKSYQKLSQYLINTEFRLGISGTAKRDDGMDLAINSVVGFKTFDLSTNKLIKEGWLIKPKIVFIKNYMTKQQTTVLEQALNKMLINPTVDYNEAYKIFISGNKQRNDIIIKIVNEKLKNKKTLILVKLVEHGQLLETIIPNSKYLFGETKKVEREEIFNNFVKGDLDVLISTISIFSEGVDIPTLDCVINVAANSGDVKTIQILGRVLRKIEGKENAQYIDFFDESKFFKYASHKRLRALKKQGHDIETTLWEEYQNQ